jgi:hypothetical protein
MHGAKVRTGRCSGSRFALNYFPGGWVGLTETYSVIEVHMDIDKICSDMKQVVSVGERRVNEPSKYEPLALTAGIAL